MENIFLILIGIFLSFVGFILIKNIFLKNNKTKLPRNLKNELKKEQQRQQRSFQRGQDKMQSEHHQKILLEERKLIAMNDPEFDLFFQEEKVLHNERLLFKNKSKWKGEIYYRNDRGQIFIVSKDGKKLYKKI